MIADRITSLLRTFTFRFQSEGELQDGIAAVIGEAGFAFKREYQLSRWDRPDFLVGGVAIEVKIDGSLANLIRQLHRYAGFNEVDSLIVVTNLSRLADLPETLNGKPVMLVLLRTL